MIYICADDYALCKVSSEHILEGVQNGVLNKISAFPCGDLDLYNKIPKNINVSLHINLVDGKCMANPEEISLIAHKNGKFRHSFGGLMALWLFNKKKFEQQLYKEIKAQVVFWKNYIGADAPFMADTHQHTHMIPSVFKVLLKVIKEEKINLKYLRIPAEPLGPFIKTPSLYFSYSGVNIIKQWLLNFLWLLNKREAKKNSITRSYFFGILFSGKMDQKRVEKVLPKFIKLAKKKNKDLEVLFHPGYVYRDKADSEVTNAKFKDFYLSDSRKTEFDAIMNISKGSVENALH